MPFIAPSEELTQSSQGFTAPDDEIQQPTPRFKIQSTPSNQSSQFSSGLPNYVPKSDNPDYALTQSLTDPNTGIIARGQKPFIPIPSATVKPDDGVLTAVGKEAYNLAKSIPEFVESPLGLATLPVAAEAKGAKVLAGAFGLNSAKDLGQQIISAHQNWGDYTPSQKAAALTDMAGTGAFAAFLGKNALKGAAVEPSLPNENQPNNIAPPENSPVVATSPAAPDATSPVAETPSPADNAGNAVPDTNAKSVLQPALRDGDKILTGGGNKHDEIILAHSNEMSPDDQVDFLTRNGDDKVERGFVDQNNNFLTKPEAEKTGVFEGKAPNSENLPDYDPNATPPPLKVSAIKAASDFDRYKELTSSLKGKTMDEVQPILKEIETIKNRNGGNPPIEIGIPSDIDKIANKKSNKLTTEETKLVPEQVRSFTTEKGSTYQINPDGTTTRNKAARPEHPGEKGIQPVSQKTFYVTPEHAQELGLFQTSGGPRMAIRQRQDGTIGVQYLEGKDNAKFEARTVMKPESKPAVGLYPVETWKDGTIVHFGNKISKVENLAPPPSPQAEGPTASLQPAKSVLQDSGSDVPLPEGTPTPAQPSAKGVPSTRGEDVLKAAVEKGLIEKTGDLPTHEGLNIKREASKAVDFINKNPDEALRISKGEKNNSGVRPEAVYTALEEKSIQGGDVATLRELANSSLPTEAGQRLKLLDSNSPFSPVKIMRDIRNAREADAERRAKTTKEKVIKEIKQSIKRNYSRLDSWEDVVRKLACN